MSSKFNIDESVVVYHQVLFQGEVEQISLMKPKAPNEHEDGMLEYMEDIIGTSVYKTPIEELAQKVEDLNDARGEKVNFSVLFC